MDMIKRVANASPRLRARIAGLLYMIIFIAAPSGAENATVTKIAITMACDTGVALLSMIYSSQSTKHSLCMPRSSGSCC
jgi:hypothetical protein